jgi:uncharacterized coiled-coil protein SlyX
MMTAKIEPTKNMAFSFLTNKQAQEKITGLEARVSELEFDVNSASATIEALQADAATAAETITGLTSERDQASAALVTAKATVADQEQTITAANDKLATFDAEVANKVQLGIANLGFKGTIPTASKEDGDNTLTFQAFNALTPRQKMDFSKAGGKITN